LTLIYLVVGALVSGLVWSKRTMTQVRTQRRFQSHAFLGEKIKVDLHVQNTGWLPVPWLDLRETLPVALVGPNSFQSVIHLGPHGEAHFEYSLEARKRGYYPIGPLSVSTGDILGLRESLQAVMLAEHLVVYPKIIPLNSLKIPSQSPQGTLRHTLPLFEDPARSFGKRGYMTGDSLRRVDWKASAATGQFQVKVFEPSIALETCILLNLNTEDYYYRSRIDSMELAIVIAASIANWITANKQMVGLMVNGRDPLMADGRPQAIPPRKGKRHLMRLLETLARVDSTDRSRFAPLLQEQRYQLGWGTTLIVVTGRPEDQLIHELYQARRGGQNALLILAGLDASDEASLRQARAFGIPITAIPSERDLSLWMQKSSRA
ncbi:MAG TPA: DUF58 domain-containing protein, partial [Anaerolineales bacterium]|nr:DUF58 domain-containing protein [Anaerolineales bacterium]